MRPIFKICLSLFLAFCGTLGTAIAQESKTTRILFLVDGSSSMLDTWNNDGSRFNAASALIGQIIDSVTAVNKDAQFGLRIFGHTSSVVEKNCYDSRLEVRFRNLPKQQMSLKLNSTSPKGVSPIAWSLQESALNDLIDNHKYAYSLILITDGGESCGGNICEVMAKIVNHKINFQPYIVSLLDYAPLQKEYECMGKYMLVTKPADFPPVINSIMKDNKYFKADKHTKYIPPTITVTPQPLIDTVILQPNKPPTTKNENPKVIAKLPIGILKPHLVFKPIKYSYPIVKIPALPKFNISVDTEPTPVVNVPTPKKTEPITKLSLKEFPKARIKYVLSDKLNYPKVAVKKLPTMNIVIEADKPAIATVAKIPYSSIKTNWRMPSLYTIPIAKKIVVKKLPKFNIPTEPEQTATNTTNNTANTTPKQPEPTQTNITATDKPNEEAPGTFQIFFTNGKGKYYKSMPQIVIKNKATQKEVYKGVRKVSNGQPEEMTLPDGEYEVTTVQSGRKASFNVVKGKNQKVEIVVGSGSLSFIHPDSKEFAKGYIAMVSKRFEGEVPAVSHATELVLTYDPANYHIEINTLPPLLYNIDLEFDYSYQIAIPKTGEVQILNENELGKVLFYHQSAEKYLLFYEMNVYGDTEYQKVNFLPGMFQVRYFVVENGKEKLKVKEFKVESLKKVALTLD